MSTCEVQDAAVLDHQVDDLLLHARGLVLVREVLARRERRLPLRGRLLTVAGRRPTVLKISILGLPGGIRHGDDELQRPR